MATSSTAICNLALNHIQYTKTMLTNLEQDTDHLASTCRLHYDLCRKFVISEHDWNFATTRKDLVLVNKRSKQWLFAYDYPFRGLKVQEIERISLQTKPIPFEVESDPETEKQYVWTNEPNAVAIYSWDVTNTRLFQPGFANTLSWYLGAQLAIAISGDLRLNQRLLSMYAQVASMSKVSDSNEGQPDQLPLSDWDQAAIGGEDA